MQITIDFGYGQVFELARQLSPEERDKLVHDLQTTDSEPEKTERKMTKEEYYRSSGKISEGPNCFALKTGAPVGRPCPIFYLKHNMNFS